MVARQLGCWLVDQGAGADVQRRRGHAPRVVGGCEGGGPADLIGRCGPAKQGLALDQVDDLLAAEVPGGESVTPPLDSMQPDPMRAGLDRELAAEGLDRVEGDLGAAQVVVALGPAAIAGSAEGEDHPDLRGIIRRTAARAVMNVVRAATSTGAM